MRGNFPITVKKKLLVQFLQEHFQILTTYRRRTKVLESKMQRKLLCLRHRNRQANGDALSVSAVSSNNSGAIKLEFGYLQKGKNT
jgi:hypothetical protein